MKVLIIGAAGNLGQRLVTRALAHGHEVTALVRDSARFTAAQPQVAQNLSGVVSADAAGRHSLAEAMAGFDCAINTAGHVTQGDSFATLFHAVVDAARSSGLPRLWMLAGAAALTIPRANRLGTSLPGVPAIYKLHEQNWRYLAATDLDWSLMCPGPMVEAPSSPLRDDLRVSIDQVPFDVPAWAAWAPGLALSLLFKRKSAELVVSYDDVAELIVSNMVPGGKFSRHRIGLALPSGETASKSGWQPGQKG